MVSSYCFLGSLKNLIYSFVMGNTLTRNFLEFYFRDEESFYLCIKAKSNKLEVKNERGLGI